MRWGPIGASSIAKGHVTGALRAVGQDTAWVHGSTQARAEDFALRDGIPRAGTDLGALRADPATGAVHVSSTNVKHAPQAMQAIAAGTHVQCEKPLAMLRADPVRMVAAAHAAGVVFATNHHLRCSGSHRAIRDLLAVGRVLSPRLFHAVHLPDALRGWRIDNPGAGGGEIPDITVHDADVARFRLGEGPASVVAQMCASGLGQGVEDSAMSVCSMPSGAMVQSHESFTHPFAGSGLKVHGTEGSIFARGVMTQRPVGEITLVTAAGTEAVPFPADDLYLTGIRALVAATQGRGRPAATGPDGIASLVVAPAVRRAAETGQRQTVDYGAAA